VPDEAVQVDVDEAQARGRPPVAEEPGLHVLGPQRLTEKRVLLEVYLPHGEVVRGTPPGVEGEECIVRHECLPQRRARARASVSRAAATIRSGVNPNFVWSAFSGAEAPNVLMPITSPSGPTYAAQPNVEACSTATRAMIAGGRTLSRYGSGCRSKSSHDGMLTTRARTPSAVSSSYAATHSDTSLPVAMRMTSGSPRGGSARTYAPLATPEAGAKRVRSSVGMACRDRTSATGSWRSCMI